MDVKWVSTVAKTILYSILLAICSLLVLFGVAFTQANTIVQDRLSDLVDLTSEDNCLSRDGIEIKNSAFGIYEQLLEDSQTSWIKFSTNSKDGVVVDYDNGFSFYVGNTEGTTYYSYLTAPQRGKPIMVKVTGYLHIPMPFTFGTTDYPDIVVPITKQYTTMGTKFYKDKI